MVVVCPPPSRATFKISELWYRNRGLPISPPLAAGYPPYEENRKALLPSVAKPSVSALKGGDSPFPIGNGLRSRKKCKRPCLHFFLCKAASMPPRPYSDTDGRTMPAQSRATFMISVLCPTADVNEKPSPNSLRSEASSTAL